jgi:hypothetical protein
MQSAASVRRGARVEYFSVARDMRHLAELPLIDCAVVLLYVKLTDLIRAAGMSVDESLGPLL